MRTFEPIDHDLLAHVSGGLLPGDGGCIPPRPRPSPQPPRTDWPMPPELTELGK
jgi:hypothetical protein